MVARLTHANKASFVNTVVNMNVLLALLGHARDPGRFTPGWRVVVAQMQTRDCWQRENFTDRTVQGGGVAAWKIAPCRTIVGHEQGVADEGIRADDKCQASRRVAWCLHDADFKVADAQQFAVVKQMIEISPRAVLRVVIEYLPEDSLYFTDRTPDGYLAAELFLQVSRRRKMVGMGMRFEQPIELQALRRQVVDQPVCAGMRCATRFWVVVQHAVDDRCP